MEFCGGMIYGKMDPHVPRPHVPQNEKLALYSGIF